MATTRRRPGSAAAKRSPVEDLSNLAGKLESFQEQIEHKTIEREKLKELVARFKHESERSRWRGSEVKQNHDRLYNEIQRLKKKKRQLDEDVVNLSNDMRQGMRELEECTRVRDHNRLQVEELYHQIELEKEAIRSMKALIATGQRELSAQMKERDTYKHESTTASKQAKQLKDRIDEWMHAHSSYIDNLQGFVDSIPD